MKKFLFAFVAGCIPALAATNHVNAQTSGNIAALESPKLASALEYWRQAKGDRLFPSKGDLNPRDMVKYLRHIHLHAVLKENLFGVRLIGTAMVDALGQDMTGEVCSPDSTHPVARRMAYILQRVVDTRRPVLMTSERAAAPRARFARLEMIGLPLSESGEKIDHVFCATVF